MTDTKKLRRLVQAATKGPWVVDRVGVGFEIAAGDNVIAQAQSIPRDSVQHTTRKSNAAFIAAANPAVIDELIDRLEAAEHARSEDYQNWMTALDRNAELIANLEAAKKDIATMESVIYSLGSELDVVADERDALRAELSKQQTLTSSAHHIAEVAQNRANQLQANIAQLMTCSQQPKRPSHE